MMRPEDILYFWFTEAGPEAWWQKSATFDSLITRRFSALHKRASMGELSGWRSRPNGYLAEIIILDQFSRNIYRDRAEAFSCDIAALILAQEAIELGHDKAMSTEHKLFLYLPFMHSESKIIHEQAVTLFQASGLEENLKFEYQHKAIIDRFGRYPHRNKILGRASSDEEKAFLLQPGSSF